MVEPGGFEWQTCINSKRLAGHQAEMPELYENMTFL